MGVTYNGIDTVGTDGEDEGSGELHCCGGEVGEVGRVMRLNETRLKECAVDGDILS